MIHIPFASLPSSTYIAGPRFKVIFDRFVTPKFTTNKPKEYESEEDEAIDVLRKFGQPVEESISEYMDIRSILADNAIKDMLAEEDKRFFDSIRTNI